MSGETNLERMKTLDDAWNAQDWDVFRKRHTSDTTVFWPGQPDPTRGIEAHQAESVAFFKSIENHLDNNPYRVMIASGDWTCTIALMRLIATNTLDRIKRTGLLNDAAFNSATIEGRRMASKVAMCRPIQVGTAPAV